MNALCAGNGSLLFPEHVLALVFLSSACLALPAPQHSLSGSGLAAHVQAKGHPQP